MAVMNEPILRETWKMRWANCPVAIELDAHRCVLGLSLQLQRSAFKLVHRFLFDFDVPVEGRFVAALEEIDVGELVFGVQAVGQENRHLMTEPAASVANPVVAAIQQLEFKAKAMSSDVQSGLIVRIVFSELCVGFDKTFRLPEPVAVALAMQDQQARIEVLVERDSPILRGADMQKAGAFRHRNHGVFACELFRIEGVQTNHVRVEIHHEVILGEVKKAQLEIMRCGKAGGSKMLVAENHGPDAGFFFHSASSKFRQTAVILTGANGDAQHEPLPSSSRDGVREALGIDAIHDSLLENGAYRIWTEFLNITRSVANFSLNLKSMSILVEQEELLFQIFRRRVGPFHAGVEKIEAIFRLDVIHGAVEQPGVF